MIEQNISQTDRLISLKNIAIREFEIIMQEENKLIDNSTKNLDNH